MKALSAAFVLALAGSAAAQEPSHQALRDHLRKPGALVSERAVQLDGAIGVDQIHPTLREAVLVEERVRSIGDHVDEGVPDADDAISGAIGRPVELELRHGARRYRRVGSTSSQSFARSARVRRSGMTRRPRLDRPQDQLADLRDDQVGGGSDETGAPLIAV